MSQSQDPNQFSAPPTGGGFSNELKSSEFTGNYNTANNPVSQIFKDGGMLSDPKTRNLIIIGVVAIFVIVGGIMFFGGGDDDEYGEEGQIASETTEEDDFQDEQMGDSSSESTSTAKTVADASIEPELPIESTQPAKPQQLPSKASEIPTTSSMPKIDETVAETDNSMSSQASEDNGPLAPPKIISPENNVQKNYDETSYPAEFSWEGSGGWIKFSRSPDMKPIVHKFRSKNNVFRYRKLLPGVWYWQVTNGAGSSEIRSFEILAPILRAVSLSSPQANGTLAGNGGIVAWTGDTKISYYRVEMGDGNWAQPPYRFATSGTQVSIQNVPAGNYQLRVGAFSEVSGRWEYTQPIPVSVQ